MTDQEKANIKGEIFDSLKAIHVKMFQYEGEIHPNWALLAQETARVARRLMPHRGPELLSSPQEAKLLRDANIVTSNGGVDVKTDSTDSREALYQKAKDMGLKVRKNMKAATIQDLIENAG